MRTLRPDTVKVCLSFAGIPKKVKIPCYGKIMQRQLFFMPHEQSYD